jgi:indolepyruvate ferredoxin oxidoreductase
VSAFARGLEEILVVEEKRSIVEDQLKEQLYNWPVEARPRVIGKFDEHGRGCCPTWASSRRPHRARYRARIRRFYTSRGSKNGSNF